MPRLWRLGLRRYAAYGVMPPPFTRHSQLYFMAMPYADFMLLFI